jgi:hypothetical protein
VVKEPPLLEVSGFLGLDLRRGVDASAPNTLRQADNLDFTIGGGVKSRAQLRLVATVDSTSLGLYKCNGFLRCAVPVPASGVFPDSPPGFRYDFFSNNVTGGNTGTLLRLTGAQVWNRTPYICIEKYLDPSNTALGTQYEHHYVPEADVFTIAAIGKTQVTLPFTPGPHLFAMSRKIIANDITTSNVWFSSTINGPTDWTNSGDAGFLPVTQHVNGDPEVRGFSYFGNKLAVFFFDTTQLWSFFPDPADNELSDIVGGAGTEQSGSIANIMGDSIYFASGGFRSLSIVVASGQSQDGDIGAAIQAETKQLVLTGKRLVSLWSPSRSQYLCAIGNLMYVFTSSRQGPDGQPLQGWTKYILPTGFNVTDMVELNAKVYVRSGTSVYVFDDTYTGEIGYSWTARFPYLYAGATGNKKQWISYEVAQSGTHALTLYPKVRDETVTHKGPTVAGSTIGINHIPIRIVSDAISPKMTGTGAWQMDSFSFRVKVGNA